MGAQNGYVEPRSFEEMAEQQEQETTQEEVDEVPTCKADPDEDC